MAGPKAQSVACSGAFGLSWKNIMPDILRQALRSYLMSNSGLRQGPVTMAVDNLDPLFIVIVSEQGRKDRGQSPSAEGNERYSNSTIDMAPGMSLR